MPTTSCSNSPQPLPSAHGGSVTLKILKQLTSPSIREDFPQQSGILAEKPPFAQMTSGYCYLHCFMISVAILSSSSWGGGHVWQQMSSPTGGRAERTVSKFLACAQPMGNVKGKMGQAEVGTSPMLRKFVDQLPKPPTIDLTRRNVTTVGMYRIKQKLHRDLPPTELFAYGSTQMTATFPGPTLEAKRSVKSYVKWVSYLTGKHMFEYDETLARAKPEGDEIPVVTHLHGIETESSSDGNAMAWFTASGKKGQKYEKQTYTYYNQQSPGTLWYHDHALGITRLNVYAGLAGMYILRDPEGSEKYLTESLPSGDYEWPLVFTDKIINPDGSLYFPSEGVTRFHPVWVPEFFGDVMLVNGKAWPYMNVEQRKYRFRMLNAANARFLQLQFNVTKLPGRSTDKTLSYAIKVTVIGADTAYLATPYITKDPLVLAPAERLDIVIDFEKLPVGTELLVANTAKTPYPNGDATSPPAQVLLKLIVKRAKSNSGLRSVPRYLNAIQDLKKKRVSQFRQLTITEYIDEETDSPITARLGGLTFADPPTEEPETGAVEYWQIINLTEDAHPIHIHLAPFQIVSRRPFDNEGWLSKSCTVPPITGFVPTPNLYNKTLPDCWTGPAYPPEPYEAGWKDTVRANPKEVTLLLIRFSPQDGGSYPFDPTKGPGYMWHCHILDHEDNEMMRPLILKSPKRYRQTPPPISIFQH